jgi:hypothetical protein
VPGAAPLAFIVAGLLLNGKPSMTSIVGSTIGGYAALYAQLGNSTSSAVSAQTEWTTVSSTLETLTRAGEARTGKQELQSTLITGFDMFKAAGSRHAALQSAGARVRSSSAQHDFKPYSVTAAGWVRGAGGGVQEIEVKAGLGSDAPKIVIARGLVSHTAADKAFSTSQWLAMALIILLDVLTLCLATALFLTPLEKMVRVTFAS